MQEFSSISTSAYDAEALAPQLNEKSAEGWTVVAIVPAGTNVVAYLSREAADTGAEAPAETVAVDAESPVEPADTETPVEEATVEETPVEPSPVDEPAGWGAVAAATASSPVDPGTPPPAATEPPEPTEPQVTEPEPEPEPEPVAPVAESTVPAGWYADPSGRFELRYWDGNQWTEHVSRDGQQFTDPPVA